MFDQHFSLDLFHTISPYHGRVIMSEEKSSLVPILIKLFGLLILLAIEWFLSLLLMTTSGPVEDTIALPVLMTVGVVFLAGLVALIISKNFKVWLLSLLAGYGISGFIALVAYVAYTLQLSFMVSGVIVGGTIAIIIWGIYYTLEQKPVQPVASPTIPLTSAKVMLPKVLKRSENLTAGLEIIEVPQDFLDSDNEESKNRQYLTGLLRHLMIASVPVGIRIIQCQSHLRLIFFTWADEEESLRTHIDILNDGVRSHLSDFKFLTHQSISVIKVHENEAVSSSFFTGVPKPIEEQTDESPITTISRVMQDFDNGFVQIFFVPSWVKDSDLRKLEQEYRRAVERSEKTVSKTSSSMFSSDEHESRLLVDVKVKKRAESLKHQMIRISDQTLCQTYVTTTCWNKDKSQASSQARRLIAALTGVLEPDVESGKFQIHLDSKRKRVEPLLKGIPTGYSSLLTIKEAANYFSVPQCDVGIRTSRRGDFSSSTRPVPIEMEKQIEPVSKTASIHSISIKWKIDPKGVFLGVPLSARGNPIGGRFLGMLPTDLDSHLGIFGNTRSGKTTTARSVVGQAYRAGVNPVILVPYRPQDWRRLKDFFPEFRIFTAGAQDISPLSINIWTPPPNVPLTKWIQRLVQVFSAWLPNDRVLTMHFDDIVHTMYQNCGWDITTGEVGRPILLPDLYAAVQEVCSTLQYGDEVKSNVQGALEARFRAMLRNQAVVTIYNTKTGITIPELLAHPTIIEMDKLSSEDRLLLTGIITAGISEYFLANPKKAVSNMLVLEEAHHLLRNQGTVSMEGSTARGEAIDGIIEMLRTSGGNGLSLVLIDQLPGSMAPEAVKLPVNVIIHALNDEAERVLVGKHAKCNDGQIEHIAGMEKGEAIVFLEREGEPKNVSIKQLEWYLESELLERTWTRDMIHDTMAPVFKKHPEFCAMEELPADILERRVKPVSVERPPIDVSKDRIVTTAKHQKFQRIFSERLKLAQEGNLEPLNEFLDLIVMKAKFPNESDVSAKKRLLATARKNLTDQNEIEFTNRLLGEATG